MSRMLGRLLPSYPVENENLVFGRKGYRDGVVELCRSSIGTPVYRIDAHDIRLAYDGLYIFHVGDGVVADGYTRVGRVLCGDNPRCLRYVVGGNLVAEHIGGDQAGAGIFGQGFQQFDHRFSSLAESGENKRPAVVVVCHVVVKGILHVDKSHLEVAAV